MLMYITCKKYFVSFAQPDSRLQEKKTKVWKERIFRLACLRTSERFGQICF
jgi:hypothetical protein